jgi:hypothetical protein
MIRLLLRYLPRSSIYPYVFSNSYNGKIVIFLCVSFESLICFFHVYWWIEATGFREEGCNKCWFLSNYVNEQPQAADRGIPSKTFSEYHRRN